jgi:hypothetical protein
MKPDRRAHRLVLTLVALLAVTVITTVHVTRVAADDT